MRSVFIIIGIIFICFLSMFLIKAGTQFINNVDPLAQQIYIIDHSKSPEIIKIKGEVMRDLIKNYYLNRFNDSIQRKK